LLADQKVVEKRWIILKSHCAWFQTTVLQKVLPQNNATLKTSDRASNVSRIKCRLSKEETVATLNELINAITTCKKSTGMYFRKTNCVLWRRQQNFFDQPCFDFSEKNVAKRLNTMYSGVELKCGSFSARTQDGFRQLNK